MIESKASRYRSWYSSFKLRIARSYLYSRPLPVVSLKNLTSSSADIAEKRENWRVRLLSLGEKRTFCWLRYLENLSSSRTPSFRRSACLKVDEPRSRSFSGLNILKSSQTIETYRAPGDPYMSWETSAFQCSKSSIVLQSFAIDSTWGTLTEN
jgi:hypothetical protein